MGNLRIKIKGQVTLELALTFVVTVVFLLLVIKVFAYFIQTVAYRHKAFEDTRAVPEEFGYQPKPMNLFQ